MKAPSEKHLQDYLQFNPQALGFIEGRYEDEIYLEYEIFARELPLSSGRPDFLAVSFDDAWYSVCVIETKKEKLTSKCLAQCLRYMRDIRQIWRFSLAGLPDPDPGYVNYFTAPRVAGLLIGYEVDEDLLIAAEAANVGIQLYEYDGQDYALELVNENYKRTMFAVYSTGVIGVTIRKLYTGLLELHHKPEQIASMGIDWSLERMCEIYDMADGAKS